MYVLCVYSSTRTSCTLPSCVVNSLTTSFLPSFLSSLGIPPCRLLSTATFNQKVGFRHAYQAHQARAALYVKNKAPASSWTSLEVSIPPAPYLKSAQQPPEGVNPSLANGATATLNLALEAMLPFDGCPECVITFTNASSGAKHR